MKIYMFIIIFLFIGAFFIISENNLPLARDGNLGNFVDLYFSWIGQIFENSGHLVGNVIKLSWLPNQTTG